MLQHCRLLALPSEVRDAIYFYVFDQSQQIHLQSPRRRRLRPARVERNDPRDLLETSRRIRYEAIPIFYHVNTLVFRKSCEAIEYLLDTKIDPAVRRSLTRLAVDDGDVTDYETLRGSQFQLSICCLKSLPNFKFLEFRAYARSDESVVEDNLMRIETVWNDVDKLTNNGHSKLDFCSPSFIEAVAPLTDAILENKMQVSVVTTSAPYEGRDKTTMQAELNLRCCNVVLDKDRTTPSAIGAAENAAATRYKRVGILPSQRFCARRDTWCEGREGFERASSTSCAEDFEMMNGY